MLAHEISVLWAPIGLAGASPLRASFGQGSTAVTFFELGSSSLIVPTARMTSTPTCRRFYPTTDPLHHGQAHLVSRHLFPTPNPVHRPTSLLPEPSPLHLNVGSRWDLAGHRHPVKPGALPCSAASWVERWKRVEPLPWSGGLCHCWRSPMQ
jgi:hypothetical protein